MIVDNLLSFIPIGGNLSLVGGAGVAIPSTNTYDFLGLGVGVAPTICKLADRIIIELNRRHPASLRGFHDIYEPLDPPHRREIPVVVQKRMAMRDAERADDDVGGLFVLHRV